MSPEPDWISSRVLDEKRPPRRSSSGFGVPTAIENMEAQLVRRTRIEHLCLLAAMPLALGIGLVLHHYYPLWDGLAVVSLVATVVCFWMYFARERPLTWFRLAAIPLAVLLCWLVSPLLASRTFSTLALAGLSLLVYASWARKPIEFYADLLYSQPMVHPLRRQNRARMVTTPSLWLLAAYLGILLVVPVAVSTTHAILAVCALCLVSILAFCIFERRPLRTLGTMLRLARYVRHHYCAYPDHQLPHAWNPAQSLGQRRLTSSLLVIAISLPLLVGLSYCIPWEPFASHYIPEFPWSLGDPGPRYAYHAYDWIVLPISPVLAGVQPGYWWSLLIGFALLFVLPDALMLSIYFRRLLALNELAGKLDEM